MRSMIFSLVTGVALTLLMRGPAPAPAPQSCYVPAVAEQELAEAIIVRIIEAVGDSLPVTGETLRSIHVNGDELTVILIRIHEQAAVAHSRRKTSIGSARPARKAGIQLAARATAVTSRMPAAKVSGSLALTP